MKISCVKVHDIAESVVASGLPMKSEYDSEDFDNEVIETGYGVASEDTVLKGKHFQRAVKLASAKDGSGHKTFLAGITVSMNVTATNAWWLQFGRYHHQQIVSSQSKMHRLQKMLEYSESETFFHPSVSQDQIIELQGLVESDDFESIVYTCPLGLELTARVVTNYLQLRTMWIQRKNHKLKEWRDFCEWIESLPFAEQFICI